MPFALKSNISAMMGCIIAIAIATTVSGIISIISIYIFYFGIINGA